MNCLIVSLCSYYIITGRAHCGCISPKYHIVEELFNRKWVSSMLV